jgi:HlyD family secretion protein
MRAASEAIAVRRRMMGAAFADPFDFSPPLLRIQAQPPKPLATWMLRMLISLVVAVLLWAALARLDIVAVSDGKLVPAGYLKIVQPAEQGIVNEILVPEGEHVVEGQPLIRMDAALTQADLRSTRAEYDQRRLALRRIDAQLNGIPLKRSPDDPAPVYERVEAQYRANIHAYENALAQERTSLEKARQDLAAAQQTKSKLEQVLPHYVEQEKAYAKLARDGFAGRIMVLKRTLAKVPRIITS